MYKRTNAVGVRRRSKIKEPRPGWAGRVGLKGDPGEGAGDGGSIGWSGCRCTHKEAPPVSGPRVKASHFDEKFIVFLDEPRAKHKLVFRRGIIGHAELRKGDI